MVRKRRKSVSTKVSKAYEQAMVAEGAPVALDLLGFGSDIKDLLSGKKRKPAKRRVKTRPKKKLNSASKTVRAKKKKPAAKSRRKR